MDNDRKAPKVIGSIVKAVDILRCFEDREERGVSELAAHLGMSKSTVFSLVKTLVHLNMLEKSAHSPKYRLGLELFRLGSLVSLKVRHIARYDLECLQEEVQETVHLARRSDLSILFIERFESVQALKIYTVDAIALPIYATAVGKAMLATLDDTQLSKVLARITFDRATPNTIAGPDQLREEIMRVRTKGVAVDNEELEEGLYCIAAPLYNLKGAAEYAISVSGPKVRIAGKKYTHIVNSVRQTAAQISAKLGHRPLTNSTVRPVNPHHSIRK